MQPPKYRHRPHWSQDEIYAEPIQRKSFAREYAPYVFGGAMLVAAFAFAGHEIGQNASASNAVADIEVPALQQTSTITQKGSLLPQGDTFGLVGLNQLRRQTVMSDGKSDLDVLDPGQAAEPLVPILKPAKKIAALAQKRLRIEPAAVDLNEEDAIEQKSVVKRLAVAAKPDEIEKSFKLKKSEKQKIIAQRRVRLAEENCLARAVYFEARSESEIGQMAVAKVILNRVKSPDYPKSICGVVYQGSNRRNSCQFSFACDGLPDDVKQPASWGQAKQIAQRAIAGDSNLGKSMNAATNYHADYVRPKWAKSMRKLVKIGRHVFYEG